MNTHKVRLKLDAARSETRIEHRREILTFQGPLRLSMSLPDVRPACEVGGLPRNRLQATTSTICQYLIDHV
jgi:hypothetical protein